MSESAANFEEIFSKGSKTFYNSTFFFPKLQRQQITRLYAFVRRADDYVDAIPQDIDQFYRFKEFYLSLSSTTKYIENNPANRLEIDSSDKFIITSFVALEQELGFDPAWTSAFLGSMERDLTQNTYETLPETVDYIYGSANVIGLYMAKIMKLPESAYKSAESLGQAFQYINFIRDIAEDITLGRNYFPQELMRKFNLKSLDYSETSLKKTEFENFVKAVIVKN
jgi:phytoene synthase